MAKILIAGLNPAWQQVFRLPGFRGGAVNRADAFWSLGSGKGLNVAKVLARRGHQVHLLQVLAGENGKRVRVACDAEGIHGLEAWAEGETRVCVTLLRDGEVDEVIAPFHVDDKAVSARLLEQVPLGCDAMVVCGSVPSGVPEKILGEIALRAGAPLLVWDSVSGLSPEILPRVSWLKVNAAEHRAMSPMLEASSARPSLLITDGVDAARLRTAEGNWTSKPPRVENVVNPIGAGDAAAAIFVDGILRGRGPLAAASAALAAASASCLNPLPTEWDSADAARFERELRWEKE
ncbi:MAG TPA: PfkB family carbohydrate kinase [Fibrobacteria bacterium]|jgi:fructose-1-phosphate kinase PfkB-like protein|nr:PfkB family carbohydrate kinase [Fibrobacteria bacterium]